ncbi:hypothetical protein JHK87_043325 [Glycine soja]|nr:hypothetical protein JHK87_043325 [Glycine soja]
MVIGLYVLEDEGGVGTIEVPPNVGPTIKANAVSQMEAAMAALAIPSEQATYRKGIPSLRSKNLAETLKQLENAIVSSPLGLNPKSDGERLIAVILPLTKEHIQAMTKLVAKSCEDASQSIRRAQQKAMDAIKNLYSSLPKDDIKRLEKEVDDLTNFFYQDCKRCMQDEPPVSTYWLGVATFVQAAVHCG